MLSSTPLKDAPEFKPIVLAAFPDYRKKKVFFSVFPGEVNINSYWDGGSREEFAIVDLRTLTRRPLPTSTHPYFDLQRYGIHGENAAVKVDYAGNITLKELPEGFALVRAGTFCGKPATAHIFFHPNNLSKLLA